MEQEAQPHQSDQPQLVEKEMGDHGKPLSYRWCKRGILPDFQAAELAAGYRNTTSRLGRCEQLLPYGKLATSSFSYAKTSRTQECYESAVVPSKNPCETRLPPALHHKAEFAYESPTEAQ